MAIKTLQILQGQFTSLHFFKATLKLFKLGKSLEVSGNISQIFGPKNDNLSVPLQTDLTRDLENRELCLRLY